MRLIRFTISAVVLALIAGDSLPASADDGYSIRVNLRDAKGNSLDPSWASLLRVSLVKAGGSQRDSGKSLLPLQDQFGAYGLSGEGPACTPQTGCNALWEIRALGFDPFTFKMADYCRTWRGEACYSVEVTVSLTPECGRHCDAWTVGVCDTFHEIRFDLRDHRGRRIPCEFDFDFVPADSHPLKATERKNRRKGLGPHRDEGICVIHGSGSLPLQDKFEIRANGFRPLRFMVADYCIEQYCGQCRKLELKARLERE